MHEALEQLRRRVLLAVPARVQLWIAQPEVGPEVDDATDAAHQFGHDLGGRSVRERQEHEIAVGRPLDVDRVVGQPWVGTGEVGVDVADHLADSRIAGGIDHVELGMPSEEPEQLCPRVPGRAEHPDPLHCMTIHTPAFPAPLTIQKCAGWGLSRFSSAPWRLG